MHSYIDILYSFHSWLNLAIRLLADLLLIYNSPFEKYLGILSKAFFFLLFITASSDRRLCSDKACFKFTFGKTESTWLQANSSCVRSGAELASIQNDAEQNLIKLNRPKKNKEYWIGLNDRDEERNFKWTDGTPYQFKRTRWHEDPSNNDNRKENCVELYGDLARWNDKDCSKMLYFICKKKEKKGKNIFKSLNYKLMDQ